MSPCIFLNDIILLTQELGWQKLMVGKGFLHIVKAWEIWNCQTKYWTVTHDKLHSKTHSGAKSETFFMYNKLPKRSQENKFFRDKPYCHIVIPQNLFCGCYFLQILIFLELVVNEQIHLSVWVLNIKMCISGRLKCTFHTVTVLQEPLEWITYCIFNTYY
jgi:hypothetical protein